MILREATDDDLRPFLDLCVKSWSHVGLDFDTEHIHRQLRSKGLRVMVAYDGPDLVAGLAALPMETLDGLGYLITMFAVDHEHRDALMLQDAVSLYACNIAMSEGRRVVCSQWLKSTLRTRYGRDVLGMAQEDRGTSVEQTDDAQAIIENIFTRRPEWQISL